MRNVALLAIVCLAGCYASAERYSDKPLQQFDKHTQYRVEEDAEGLTIEIYHERYQMFGNDDRLSTTGLAAAEQIALKEANSRGKLTQPIDQETVKSNTGRDAWGNSSWSAMVRVLWRKT